MNEADLETLVQAKGLNAPRLTPDHINSQIVASQFCVFDNTTVTVCCLILKNGFTVTGESACASPANFDEDIGRRLAFDNAREKIWQLEGYLLRNELSTQEGATL
jgi:hypothetical protein